MPRGLLKPPVAVVRQPSPSLSTAPAQIVFPPTKTEITPLRASIFRIRLFEVSAIYTLPCGSVATPPRKSVAKTACVAGHPSPNASVAFNALPAKHGLPAVVVVPPPAIVLIVYGKITVGAV